MPAIWKLQKLQAGKILIEKLFMQIVSVGTTAGSHGELMYLSNK